MALLQIARSNSWHLLLSDFKALMSSVPVGYTPRIELGLSMLTVDQSDWPKPLDTDPQGAALSSDPFLYLQVH